jgi:hypothetical protein
MRVDDAAGVEDENLRWSGEEAEAARNLGQSRKYDASHSQTASSNIAACFNGH